MGRSVKLGLDYFPFQTDIFSDRKIRRLIKKFDSDGFLVYCYILTEVYRDKGCYLEFTEDLAFDISDYFTSIEEIKVNAIISYCTENNLFNKKIFLREKILTSKGIQCRYKFIIKQFKRIANIPLDIDIENLSSEEKDISSEEKKDDNLQINPPPITSEEISISTKETNIKSNPTPFSSIETGKMDRAHRVIHKNNSSKLIDISSEGIIKNGEEINIYSSEMMINSEFGTQKKRKENNIYGIYIPFEIDKEDLIEVFLEKNYPHYEISRFLNYYDGLGWESGNKKIKNLLALARIWKQQNEGENLMPKSLHKGWWKVWIFYKEILGRNNAKHLLTISPKIVEDKLIFNCNRKTMEMCEDNINSLKKAIINGFGDKKRLEYFIKDFSPV